MTNTQLAAFSIGVAIAVVIVGTVLVILFALRGFKNNRTRGGPHPGFEHSSGGGETRELAVGLSTTEPASYRVVHWTPAASAGSRRIRRPPPATTPASEANVGGAASQETVEVVASPRPPPPRPPPPRVRFWDVTVATTDTQSEIVLDGPENSHAR